MNTLQSLIETLEQGRNEITVDEPVRTQALRSVERMVTPRIAGAGTRHRERLRGAVGGARGPMSAPKTGPHMLYCAVQ